ncbi:MAG: extracellular solute-binding protein, partial [Halobacteriovoraceae bacterium]|nr:extracellular solute-binding protein [Halobacteriovoraceae bacterium]
MSFVKILFFGFALFFSNNLFSSKKELLVYSARKEHLIKKVFQMYQKERGVTVKYVTGKAGMLIEKLKEEGDRSPADLLLTVDGGNLWYAADKELFTALSFKKLKEIPDYLKDVENRWVGLSMRARILVYNTGLLSSSSLSSYEDLSLPKWKGQLCLRTSKKVYNQSLVAMLINQHGRKKAKQIVDGWVKNTVDIFPSDSLVLKAVASGQCKVGIVNSYYYGRLMKKRPFLPLKIFWPNQKSYGAHVNVSGVGILKSSKNKKLAENFLQWLLTPRIQKIFSELNLEYPVHPKGEINQEVLKWGLFKANNSFNLSLLGVLQKDA